jgi:hypothetical protein
MLRWHFWQLPQPTGMKTNMTLISGNPWPAGRDAQTGQSCANSNRLDTTQAAAQAVTCALQSAALSSAIGLTSLRERVLTVTSFSVS